MRVQCDLACNACFFPCGLVGLTHERLGLIDPPIFYISQIVFYGCGLGFFWMLTIVFLVLQVPGYCALGLLLYLLYLAANGRRQVQIAAGLSAGSVDSIGKSLCIWFFCCPCANCQEARTVKPLWLANGCRPLNPEGAQHAALNNCVRKMTIQDDETGDPAIIYEDMMR